MHTIKANGSFQLIYYQRSYNEIHRKPHICSWKGTEDGVPIRRWAVYYLMGKQSRIRCVLYAELKDAIEQARRVHEFNRNTRRFLT
jgi:hypothetical protein